MSENASFLITSFPGLTDSPDTADLIGHITVSLVL